MKQVVICDANILIDYSNGDKEIIGLITENLYQIKIPLPVWEEVEDLSDEDAAILGIEILEPSMEQIYEAVTMHGGGLSDEDRICFIIARDDKALCATNDSVLRKMCLDNNIGVLWGLEIIAQLCDTQNLTKSSARKLVLKIAQENKTITEEIVTRFIERITGKGG
ncbi:MAG: hypothetical protein U9O59_07175 [Actinomycetota bacterium]|nr:hypothetical protein [Actinomycetota bacterium]